MKAIWHDTILALSDNTVVVEGNHYFPLDAMDNEYFRPSDHTTVCPWKGTAHYYDIVVDEEVNANAAWYYPEPKAGAEQVGGRVAFWNGVEIEE